MISKLHNDKTFKEECRIKYNNINNRVTNRESYLKNNITNNFTFPHFLKFAQQNGFETGLHCHRPNRYGDYSENNLVFISPEEHARITGLERRKLTDDQIKEVVDLSHTTSLRKIANLYGVSHVTIYRYLQKTQNEKY